jgi:enamine deaminase RidA (YjgF/YER057c/UK114 family)
MDLINPPELGEPRGWTNGIVAPAGGRVLFVAGQTAADASGRVTVADFTAQFDAALAKTMTIVRAAGGRPDHIARMTIYVSDLEAYRSARGALRDVWQARMGKRYPAMTLVEVSRLLDENALVEIETTAVLP